ncbi:MAG: heat-inducible transcriptional repressor HrcA [Myxococcota bacterium]
MSELTFRTRRILYATITEYIATGEPVGSRRLSKRYGINLSPATIRNVLADLEDAGYLHQPHASAGRVPTDMGFRVFVDALVQMREVSAQDRGAVLDRLRNLAPGTDVLREAGELLSALTGAAAVVTTPRPEEEALVQLRFMPLREGQLLAVLVTAGGAVQNRVLVADVSEVELERVNNLLAELLASNALSLVGVRAALRKEVDEQRGVVEDARAIVEVAVGASQPVEMVIEGQGRLFDRPEFLDADKIRRYLRAFDDKERLLTLLGETLASGGVRVLIGSEANLEDVKDVSVISTPYATTGSAGSIGIIGPTRMDYGKVVPLVDFTAKVVSKVLQGDEENDT